VCWKKYARYFDVARREILIEPDALGMTADPERARLASATC
jgi:hypothetical protein